jgi:hypothetical protein
MVEQQLLVTQLVRVLWEIEAYHVDGHGQDDMKDQHETETVSVEEEEHQHGAKYEVGGHGTVDTAEEEERYGEQDVADEYDADPYKDVVTFETVAQTHQQQGDYADGAEHRDEIRIVLGDALDERGGNAEQETHDVDHICHAYPEGQFLITRISIYELL